MKASRGKANPALVNELVSLSARLLASPSEARNMGEAAGRAAISLGGAVKRTHIAVEELLAYARS